MTQKSAAVVVGRNLNALGIVRSLAAGDVPVVLVCTSRFDVAALSRHCRIEVVRALSGRELIEALKALGGRFAAKPVLFLTEEDSVASLSEMGAELADLYHIGVPSRRTTELLSDKALFHEFATGEGLPLPHSRIIRSAEDIGSLRDFELPMIVKPASKDRIAGGADKSVVLASSYEEAFKRCQSLVAARAGALVQEWIDGPDRSIYFCLFHADAEGTPVALFTGRKLASFPPRVGSTAICAPAPEAHEELAAITTKLTRRLAMSGLGSLEFKWDGRAGRFVIIEPTVGRSDWQQEIATLAGVNIPLAAYAHSCGLPQIPRPAEPARIVWRSSFRHRAPPGSIEPGARVVDGYWRLSDPLPGLAYYLIGPLRRLPRRVLARISPRFRWPAPTPGKVLP
jgi:predicted ATP-grasp superfamily ATP-dependent carboligase